MLSLGGEGGTWFSVSLVGTNLWKRNVSSGKGKRLRGGEAGSVRKMRRDGIAWKRRKDRRRAYREGGGGR